MEWIEKPEACQVKHDLEAGNGLETAAALDFGVIHPLNFGDKYLMLLILRHLWHLVISCVHLVWITRVWVLGVDLWTSWVVHNYILL